MMWITTVFVTLFLSFNALIAIKVIYCTLFLMFTITNLQMIYKGPQPTWVSPNVSAPVCLQGYSLPSLDLFTTLFIIFYTNYCYTKRSKKLNLEQKKNKMIWIIIMGIIIFGYFFVRYICALNFLVEIIIGGVYFVLFFFACKFMDSSIDGIIRKSAVSLQDSKKYVFLWFFYLIIFQIISVVIYGSADFYMNLNWI